MTHRTLSPLRAALFAGAALLGLAALSPSALAQSELRIGLQDDPDSLDPAQNWSFVGRHVLQSMCDKLVDIDSQGNIAPMLATKWAWSEDGKTLTLNLRPNVVFHDGTPFDAAAAKFSLDRGLTMKSSRRRAEIDAIDTMDVVDPLTLRINLKAASVPLLAALTDRAGMMVSPTAAQAAGDNFAKNPVCAGPYKFVEHKAQDRIVLEKFPQHYRAKDFAFNRLIFQGMPDSNVRLLNLKSNQLQLIERLSPTDISAVEKDKTLQVFESATLGYYAITFNMANGDGAASSEFSKSRALRQAFDLAIDRNAINQVAFEGRFDAGNQAFPPQSPWYDKAQPVKPRDLDAAKAKLKEAGIKDAKIELLVPTDPQRQQVAQIVQSMVAEAGITMTIRSVELMSLLAAGREGKFQAHLVGWSGRVDPDLNYGPLLGCGAAGNDGKYCNRDMDAILAKARAIADPESRKPLYAQVAKILLDDLPLSYIYHGKWTFAARANLKGLKAYPDGVIRLDSVTAQ
ncbi:ABC transporter substrate-binding protein [Terrarubrum flagellatum]|uniref:ABC transporter substrate-binding protein n=1 Tax=Terrirubrum flagellatum TaxID=2895980 RepID=UPI00314521EB